MGTKLEALLQRRARERETLARLAALRALDQLDASGIKAVITGSLARGPFLPHSDVDFLVYAPGHGPSRDQAERLVASEMGPVGLSFDIVFTSELSAEVLKEFENGSVSASDLRKAASPL